MGKFITVFKRCEKKYVLTSSQYRLLMSEIGDRLVDDEYRQSTICNIYFDTPDYRLIRASIEKPVFKEKLRIRSYEVPTPDSNVFVEIKRKDRGVVYKRRVSMSYRDAIGYLCRNGQCPKDNQITKEIDYFKSFYGNVRPAVSLFYDRLAFKGKDDDSLRITFDFNIRYRTKRLDLQYGTDGKRLTDSDRIVMEVKCLEAMPLWLCRVFSELEIFPASYSKYGNAYKEILQSALRSETVTV